MAFRDVYRSQVALLMRVIPFVAAEDCFALKGGTAINLFIRDMPRLSVDIDLTYLPVQPRAASLSEIDAAMKRIAERIKNGIPKSAIAYGKLKPEGTITKLIVRLDGIQIKIEVTPVLRGSVYAPTTRRVSPNVEAMFGFAEMRIVSFPDLYGGKIVAALDRQHPRDFFDVRDLLAAEGIDDELRRAFLVYLLSHDRPMHEVIAPTRKKLDAEFARGFEGMTAEPVRLGDLENTREAIIDEIVSKMPKTHRQLIVSFVRGDSVDWSAVGLPDMAALPAIRWRQQNLEKLEIERRGELARLLMRAFSQKGQISK